MISAAMKASKRLTGKHSDGRRFIAGTGDKEDCDQKQQFSFHLKHSSKKSFTGWVITVSPAMPI